MRLGPRTRWGFRRGFEVAGSVFAILTTCCHLLDAAAQGMVLGSAAVGFLPQSIQENQYICLPWGENSEFYTDQQTVNPWAIPIWLTPDINRDGYCDLFIAFATSEYATEPFVMRFYDPVTGRFLDASDKIRGNTGQPYARRSMAVDLNADSWPDFIIVSHPERDDRDLSFLDIVMSDGIGGWEQRRILTGTRSYPPLSNRAGYWHGFAVGDVDLDGDQDIIMADWYAESFILENVDSGEFVERPAFDDQFRQMGFATQHFTMELLDVNEDGFLDMLAWGGQTYSLIYGDGNMVFKGANYQPIPTSWWPPEYGIMDYHLADLNRDGRKDLVMVVTDYRTWRLVILLNTGLDHKGWVKWEDASSELNSRLITQGLFNQPWPRFISILDVNEDGYLDIVTQTAFSFKEGWVLLGRQEPMQFIYRTAPITGTPYQLAANVFDNSEIELTWRHLDEEDQSGHWVVYHARHPFGDRSGRHIETMVTYEPLLALASLEPGFHAFRVGWEDDRGVTSALTESVEVQIPDPVSLIPHNSIEHPFLGIPYPNPASGGFTVTLELAERGSTSLTVWDAMGRQVRTVLRGDMQPGVYNVPFAADGLPAGTYFIRLQAGSFRATRQISLLD